ncbi:MAG: hypothetical protein KJP18_11820, partial [Gemmatimonadetes bacterium]|nr:hypothetical protein [Gemmatimonadota bacterium]
VVVQWRAVSEQRALEQLRVEVGEARTAARACSQSLAADEAEFQLMAARVDSLRGAVDALEALDARGVPAERYEEYLETVDAFNDGVSRWERDADRLRQAETACRDVVAGYNALADSARAANGLQSPGT